MFVVFLILCIMQDTCKLKSAEKDIYRKKYVPKLRFYLFSPNIYAWLPKYLKLLQSLIIFMSSQKKSEYTES